MVLSSYWPIKAVKSDNNQLWNKVLRAIPTLGLFKDPLEYAKDTIHRRLVHHCRRPENVIMLAGDLNSTWGSSSGGGCHPGLQSWASSANWTNPLHSLSLLHSNSIYTHWISRHIQEGIEHVGKSWIDHILVHTHGNPQVLMGGSESHNDWFTVSDHRPLWIDIHLPNGGTDPVSDSSVTNTLPRILRRDNKRAVDRYKKTVSDKVARLLTSLSPGVKLAQLARISVEACPKPD